MAAENTGAVPTNTLMYARIFLYLQLLDFLTTLLGFKLGAGEMSPFVRCLIQFGPIAGVALSKFVALGMAGLCLYLDKGRLLRWVCYWYAALAIWNICVILASPPHAFIVGARLHF
jgi:Domain of unknown function (DUF5658)